MVAQAVSEGVTPIDDLVIVTYLSDMADRIEQELHAHRTGRRCAISVTTTI